MLDKLQRERSYRIGKEERGYTSARNYEEWAKAKGIAT
ncbi:minor head protein [Brevibacillus agri BAB-2500]|nr:minor head protein [Brevibacillus agri BAB-2500]